jgi:phosphoribosylformylglycinamidine synthase
VQKTCLEAADKFLLKSAHDCSDGGLAVAIIESCFSSLNRQSIGAEIELNDENLNIKALLFGETPSRIVVSFAEENLEKVQSLAAENNCPFAVIGKVSGTNLNIKASGENLISASIADLETVWAQSLKNQLEN